MDFTNERKNIHELANHLTIIQGAVKKVLKNIEDKALDLPEEKERLQKADDYIRRGIESLKALRSGLHEKIDQYQESP